MCTCTEVQLLSLGENGNINGSEDEGGWMPYASLAAVTVVGVLTGESWKISSTLPKVVAAVAHAVDACPTLPVLISSTSSPTY